jgi:hypothetical protein
MADPVVTFINVLEGVQKIEAVLVGLEDRLSLVASRGNMIHSAGIFDAEGTGHEGRISEVKGKVKHSIPDPEISFNVYRHKDRRDVGHLIATPEGTFPHRTLDSK